MLSSKQKIAFLVAGAFLIVAAALMYAELSKHRSLLQLTTAVVPKQPDARIELKIEGLDMVRGIVTGTAEVKLGPQIQQNPISKSAVISGQIKILSPNAERSDELKKPVWTLKGESDWFELKYPLMTRRWAAQQLSDGEPKCPQPLVQAFRLTNTNLRCPKWTSSCAAIRQADRKPHWMFNS